jgi:surface antigen
MPVIWSSVADGRTFQSVHRTLSILETIFCDGGQIIWANVGLSSMRAVFCISIVMALVAAPEVKALPVLAPVQPLSGECVPVARALSGIQIRGDAHTWWGQAEGRYARGQQPRKGAVLAFMPHGAMRLGHVATVSRIVDDRTILIMHSNWSPINGHRGQLERDVKVIDVSDRGDWSAVRVWFAPSQDLGTTTWPIYGFIYPGSGNPLNVAASPTASASGSVRLATGHLDYLGPLLRRLR